MTRIINLCDHPVSIALIGTNARLTLPAAEYPARSISRDSDTLVFVTDNHGHESMVRVGTRTWVGTINLPDPEPDTLYIVSVHVIQAAPHRRDLVHPWWVRRWGIEIEEGPLLSNGLMREVWS